jgi:hypothetical protein
LEKGERGIELALILVVESRQDLLEGLDLDVSDDDGLAAYEFGFGDDFAVKPEVAERVGHTSASGTLSGASWWWRKWHMRVIRLRRASAAADATFQASESRVPVFSLAATPASYSDETIIRLTTSSTFVNTSWVCRITVANASDASRYCRFSARSSAVARSNSAMAICMADSVSAVTMFWLRMVSHATRASSLPGARNCSESFLIWRSRRRCSCGGGHRDFLFDWRYVTRTVRLLLATLRRIERSTLLYSRALRSVSP